MKIGIGDMVWTWYHGAKRFKIIDVFKDEIWLENGTVMLCRSEGDIFKTEEEVIKEMI